MILLLEAIGHAGVTPKVVVYGFVPQQTNFTEFLDVPIDDKFVPAKAESLKETALIFYTHGCTDLPRGSCLSHYAILAQAKNFM